MTARRLRFGFSPCPNDTYLFHALVHGLVPLRGIELVPELADIEELNTCAAGADPLEVTKLSIPAYAGLRARYRHLDAGAAMGFGVGPIVVQRRDASARALADLAGATVAIPGERTTAWALYQRFAPPAGRVLPMRFDRIFAAVTSGEADAGVVIHEGRFTFAAHGLKQLADLGALWEQQTRLPLPLAVIAIRHDLPRTLDAELTAAIRTSLDLARADPTRSRDYVAAHAQELDPAVCAAHIRLYVNDYTRTLDATALDTLLV